MRPGVARHRSSLPARPETATRCRGQKTGKLAPPLFQIVDLDLEELAILAIAGVRQQLQLGGNESVQMSDVLRSGRVS